MKYRLHALVAGCALTMAVALVPGEAFAQGRRGGGARVAQPRGPVVVRRPVVVRSYRPAYYGSLFIHVGVIFQKPSIDNVRVISEPLIKIRYGNAMWTARGFEIWMFKWPQLIWSFPEYSDDAKRAVCRENPWRSAKALFHHRAMGSYSSSEFHKFWPAADRKLKSPAAWLIIQSLAIQM